MVDGTYRSASAFITCFNDFATSPFHLKVEVMAQRGVTSEVIVQSNA